MTSVATTIARCALLLTLGLGPSALAQPTAAEPAPPPPAAAPRILPSAPLAPLAPPATAEPAQGLTLERAVQLALSRNEGARIADEQVLAAEARVDRAWSLFLPDVTVTGNYLRRARERPPFQKYDALNGNIGISMTLFDARSFPLLRQAKLEREAQRLDSREQKRLLAFNTASAFLAALSQDNVLSAAAARVELAHKSATEARARFEAGLASSNDVTRVELELSAALRDEAASNAEVELSRVRLSYFIDTPLEAALVPPAELLDAAKGRAPTAVTAPSAIAQRLDIAALRRRADALDAFADEPKYRLLPTATLSAVGRATNEVGFVGQTFDGNVQLTLAWALYDGGERYAERRERLALAAASELQADASSRLVSSDLREAAINLTRGQRVLAQAELSTEIGRRNAAETGELYKQGLATALAVADASARLFEAEVALARARYDVAIAILEERRVLGLDPFGKEPPP